MAVGSGDPFDDVRRQLEGLADDVAKAREVVTKETAEARRQGRDLRLPLTPVPTAAAPSEEIGRRLRGDLDAARNVAKALEEEYAQALKTQRQLSNAQTALLNRIVAAQGETIADPTTRGLDVASNQRRTLDALVKRGLADITWQSREGRGASAVATSTGLGVARPEFIKGDLSNQLRFVDELEEKVRALGSAASQAETPVQRAARALADARIAMQEAAQARRAAISVEPVGKGFELREEGRRVSGTGRFRSQEAAESRRDELLLDRDNVAPENARWVNLFRDASDEVRRLAEEMGRTAPAIDRAAEAQRRYTYEILKGAGRAPFQVIRRDETGRGLELSRHQSRQTAQNVITKLESEDETEEIARRRRVSYQQAEKLYRDGVRVFAQAEQDKVQIARQADKDREDEAINAAARRRDEEVRAAERAVAQQERLARLSDQRVQASPRENVTISPATQALLRRQGTTAVGELPERRAADIQAETEATQRATTAARTRLTEEEKIERAIERRRERSRVEAEASRRFAAERAEQERALAAQESRRLRPRASAGGGGREAVAAISNAERAVQIIEQTQRLQRLGSTLSVAPALERQQEIGERALQSERELYEARQRGNSVFSNAIAQARLQASLLDRIAAAAAGLEPVFRRALDPLEVAARQADRLRFGIQQVVPPTTPPPQPPPAPPTGPRFQQEPAFFPAIERDRGIGGTRFPSRQRVEADIASASDADRLALGYKNAQAAVDAYEASFRQAADASRANLAALRDSRLEAARASAEYGAFSNEMRKHGAATTEFLTALAQGRTTIGEIGFQAAATAGKFAAWTAASVGVYGALTTLAATGRGAIDSMSGVNELSRFINDLDTEQAQEQFRALSREFNLPIGTVTEAFAGMGRTFGDQTQAFEGARQTLLAMRVGELEVADSTRFLSAIVAGFGLTASDLPQVIDQINQAQNRFNFQIRDGVAGISRAAGTWKAAAADGQEATDTFSTLLAVMTTAQRSTGATGEVVGTALRRSAEFIGREANRTQLRGFGIDPDQGITAIFQQAFAQVQTGQVQGQDITRLATALSSPQLASILAPTLQNFQLFNQVLRETNAEAARGSARKELEIQLASIREQASRVITTLEQLGSALGQAGAFDALGGLLALINSVLDASVQVVDTFNELPDGLQKALIYGGQLYGIFRLLRRFNIGESFADAAARSEGIQRTFRRPFGTFTQRGGADLGVALRNDPTRQAFRTVVADQDAGLKQLRQERERLASETRQLGNETARARERVRDFGARGPVFPAGSTPFVRRQIDQQFQNDLTAATRQADSLQASFLRSDEAVKQLNREIRYTEDRLARVQRVGRRDPGEALNILRNDPVLPVATTVPTFSRPADRTSVRFDQPADTSQIILPPGVQQKADQAAAAIVTEAGEATMNAAVAGSVAGATRAADQVTASTGRVRQSITAARGGMGRLATGIRGLGTALLGFLGPLEFAFLGLVFIPEAIAAFQRRAEEQRQQVERFRAPVLDEAGFRARLEEAQEAYDAQQDALEKRQEALDQTRPESSRRSAQRAALERVDDSGRPAVGAVEQAQIDFVSEAQNRALEQRRARQEGRVVPFRFLPDIASDLERDIAAILRGDDEARSALTVYNRYHEAIANSMEAQAGSADRVRATGVALERAKAQGADPEEIQKLQAQYDTAVQAQQRVSAALAALNTRIAAVLDPQASTEIFRTQRLAEVASALQTQAGLIDQFGVTRGRLQVAAAAYSVAVQKFGSSDDPGAYLDEIDRAEQGFQATLDEITDRATRRFNRANTPRQARRFATRGFNDLDVVAEELRQQERIARQEEEAARRRRDIARRNLARARRSQPRGIGSQLGRAGFDALGSSAPDAGFSTEEIQRLQGAFDVAREDFRKAADNAKGAKDAVRRGMRRLADAAAAIFDALSQQTERIDARNRLRGARAALSGDPVAQANSDLRAARQRESTIRRFLENATGRVRQQLITDLLNAQAATAEAVLAQQEATQQRVADELARMERKSTLNILRLPETQRGGATLGALQDRLARAQELGADEETIDNLNIQILEQQQSNAEDAKQRAEEAKQRAEEIKREQIETIQSIFNLRRSRTDNENRLADLDVREARRLRNVPGQTRNERRDSQARLNEALRDRERTRTETRLNQIELEHDIGRLSDAAYIASLQRLLKTLDKGTQIRRQVRETLLRFKHQMREQDTADLEIDIGNIRIPNPYEIRSLIKARDSSVTAAPTVQQSNVYNLSVRNDKDLEVVGGALRDIHGTNMGALRNGGMA